MYEIICFVHYLDFYGGVMKKKVFAAVSVILMLCALAACAASRCTMENYNKITVAKLNMTTFRYEGGMTLDEVEDILGDYTSSTSTSVMGYSATAYVWGNQKKNITVSFYNGRALFKTQTGL